MKLMRLLADADQTSARGQRNPLKGIHTSEGKLLLKNFEIAAGLNLYDQLVSINYVEEITSCKKLGQTNKRSIIKRRLKPPVFRSHSALIPCTRISINWSPYHDRKLILHHQFQSFGIITITVADIISPILQ